MNKSVVAIFSALAIIVFILFARSEYEATSSKTVMKFQAKDSTSVYELPFCSCVRFGRNTEEFRDFKGKVLKESTCSDFATQRGGNQKVFSYSLYNPGDDNNEVFTKYFSMMYSRSKYIKIHFPDWLVRIYHNVSRADKLANRYLCKIFCKYDHVDFCDVTDIPTIKNLFKMQPIGRLWRFAVIGDPLVSIFLIRDADSYILDRERFAVMEWLLSNKEFHLMRDHPFHKPVMLAGLWGGRNNRKEELSRRRDLMLSQPANYSRNFDQFLLEKYIWPYIQVSLLQHDSYTCNAKSHHDSSPYPIKRKGNKYVGWGPYKLKYERSIAITSCPLGCRPKQHPEWLKC